MEEDSLDYPGFIPIFDIINKELKLRKQKLQKRELLKIKEKAPYCMYCGKQIDKQSIF